ncbi:RNA-binding S4 domain-containing protein [Mycolicibacterium sp. CR10]|uniref:RNA-binding S4 domain-containing protein n=1 Tax=Mycolicibacterium sp. CR10 TaxID=2562314 RepID=UPI0010C0F544|nr:RNA-binding S4 domain-containing protein [Mycolicibacterium sp. CR10]
MAHQSAEASDVPIRDASIRLGQFLKLAGLIDSGADAKSVIADGLVSVNGDVETRRGRQLRIGDTVVFADRGARVADGR